MRANDGASHARGSFTDVVRQRFSEHVDGAVHDGSAAISRLGVMLGVLDAGEVRRAAELSCLLRKDERSLSSAPTNERTVEEVVSAAMNQRVGCS